MGDVWDSIIIWGRELIRLSHESTLSIEQGSISKEQAASNVADYMLFSDIGILLSSVLLVSSILMLAIQPMLAPYMFILSIVAPMILGLIIQTTVSATDDLGSDGNNVKSGESGVSNWLHSFYTGDYQWLNRLESFAFMFTDFAWQLGGALSKGFLSVGLLISICGLVVGISGYGLTDDLKCVATIVSGALVGLGLYFSTSELSRVTSKTMSFTKVAWSLSAISFTYYCVDLVI